jgi:protein-S-isoprenylcysteine O-methyltransferase Ste14
MEPHGGVAGWLVRNAIVVLVLGAILFLVSGRTDWIEAWVYLGLFFSVLCVTGLMLARLSPDLLVERSRLHKGTKKWDKVLAPAIAVVGPAAMYLTAAWDARCGWSSAMPAWLEAAAFAVCVAGPALTLWAMISNRYFSATVRIQTERGHVVVTRGPYQYVRHPGYVGVILFDAATPLALGSWWSLIPGVFTGCLLILRTLWEDRTLIVELEGYRKYTEGVRYRLVPGVW